MRCELREGIGTCRPVHTTSRKWLRTCASAFRICGETSHATGHRTYRTRCVLPHTHLCVRTHTYGPHTHLCVRTQTYVYIQNALISSGASLENHRLVPRAERSSWKCQHIAEALPRKTTQDARTERSSLNLQIKPGRARPPKIHVPSVHL